MTEVPPHGKLVRILVAESDALTRTAIRQTLESDQRIGSVLDARDGDGAVAGSDAVDVVIIDLSIRGLGCLGTIAHIHALGHRPAILALESDHDGWLRDAATHVGADDVICWPADQSVLADRAVLAMDRAAAER